MSELTAKGILTRRVDESERRRHVIDIAESQQAAIDQWLAPGAPRVAYGAGLLECRRANHVCRNPAHLRARARGPMSAVGSRSVPAGAPIPASVSGGQPVVTRRQYRIR